VKFDTTGDKARIWLGADVDELWVELECETNGCGYLRLFNDTTQLAETAVQGADLGEWHTLIGCYHEGDDYAEEKFVGMFYPYDTSWLVAGGGPKFFVLEETDISGTGTKVGLGTGDSCAGTVKFNDFDYNRHGSDDWPQCGNCEKCEWFVDDFQDDDLNCVWTQESGSWAEETAKGGAYTTSSNAILRLDTLEPEIHSEGGYATASFLYTDYGAVLRVYVDYVTSGASIMAEMQLSSGISNYDGYIKLYNAGTLIDSRANMLITGSSHAISVCAQDNGVVTANFGGTPTDPWALGVAGQNLNGGDKAAVGIGANNYVAGFWGIAVRSFGSTRTKNAENECNPCSGGACEHCPQEITPVVWTVEIDGWTNKKCADCDDWNATVIATDLINQGLPCQWQGRSPVVCDGYYGAGVSHTISVLVQDHDASNWALWVLVGPLRFLGGVVYYRSLIPKTTFCTDVQDEVLTYYTGDLTNEYCASTGLTVTVSAN
jgi:hypothetical protein